jgi:hypothetical protein
VVLASGKEADQRGFPAIAAGGGRVHAAWIEEKGGRHHVWYRCSADGGASWSERIRLSRPERSSGLLTDDGFVEPFGHYMSLAADGKGTVHAVWAVGQLFKDTRKTRGEVWYNVVHW